MFTLEIGWIDRLSEANQGAQDSSDVFMFYLLYGCDRDDKEEGQTAGDWTGGSVNDKLQEKKNDEDRGALTELREQQTGEGGDCQVRSV